MIKLLGQVALHLNDLMVNNGKTTKIDENVCLYGRIFGEINGFL